MRTMEATWTVEQRNACTATVPSSDCLFTTITVEVLARINSPSPVQTARRWQPIPQPLPEKQLLSMPLT